MSIFVGPRTVPASGGGVSAIERVKAYFFSDSGRAIQTVLGLIWLLDGALQFQAFMYGKGFIQFLHKPHGGSAALGIEQRDLGRDHAPQSPDRVQHWHSRWCR